MHENSNISLFYNHRLNVLCIKTLELGVCQHFINNLPQEDIVITNEQPKNICITKLNKENPVN